MNDVSSLWALILESNTFNFIILVIIIAVVMQKLKVADFLEKLKIEIVSKIEDSKLARENAKKSFEGAKFKIEHIEDEISEKISLAQKRADNVAGSIEEVTRRKILQIENNVKKVLETEEKTLLTSLTQNTANSSIGLAEKYVKYRLMQEPELHGKYIEEGINELDKVTL